MNARSLIANALLFALSTPALWAAEADLQPNTAELASLIPNFGRVNARIYRGSEPSAQALKALKSAGVKTVVDLRHYSHDWRKEKAAVHKLGMTYIHLPMGYFKTSDSQLKELLDVVSNPVYQPVYIHCRQGADRTGAVVAIYRLTKEHWSLNNALDEMRRHHFKPWQLPLKKTVKTCALAGTV